MGASTESYQRDIPRGPTPEWIGFVTGTSPAEGRFIMAAGFLFVGELAQVPRYPEG